MFLSYENNHPGNMYGDDLKDSKHGLDVNDAGDMDDMMSTLGRKESRIPVAIRRLRTRPGDRPPPNLMSMGDIPPDGRGLNTPRIGADGKLIEEWATQGTWGTNGLAAEKEPDLKKLARIQRRKSAPATNQLVSSGAIVPSGDSKNQPLCPHCNRSFAMITKDGIYVAFSIGFAPLLLLVVITIVLIAVPTVGPMLRRLRAPPPEPPAKKGFFNRFRSSKS